MTRPAHVLGAILAGGRSTRFGRDKALAMLRGRTLIERSAIALGAHVGQIVVCGRAVDNLKSLEDRPAPGLGPLGGLNAALRYAAEQRFEAVLTSGCDMPVFPAALVDALVSGGPAIVEGLPLIGYWPASLAPVLDDFLTRDGNRAIWRFAEAVGARSVPLAGIELPNINTPENLIELERRWVEPD